VRNVGSQGICGSARDEAFERKDRVAPVGASRSTPASLRGLGGGSCAQWETRPGIARLRLPAACLGRLPTSPIGVLTSVRDPARIAVRIFDDGFVACLDPALLSRGSVGYTGKLVRVSFEPDEQFEELARQLLFLPSAAARARPSACSGSGTARPSKILLRCSTGSLPSR